MMEKTGEVLMSVLVVLGVIIITLVLWKTGVLEGIEQYITMKELAVLDVVAVVLALTVCLKGSKKGSKHKGS